MSKSPLITVILVIILAGVSLWIVLGTKGISGPTQDPDKIAIPAEGSDMNAQISKYFGRALHFIIYDLKRDVFWNIPNSFINEQHAAGLRAAAMLVNKRVGVIVAKNIGPEPCKTFNNSKIEIYIGASGTVSDGIKQYNDWKLIKTTKPNVPTHYGLPGRKPCPNVPGQPKTRIENPMKKVAWPTRPSNLQRDNWSIACPDCNTIIVIPQQGLKLPDSIVCPNCGKRIKFQHTQQVQATCPFLR